MTTIEAIKPGPKPKKEDGTPDRRRRVNPPNKPKHPKLKPHDHTKGDWWKYSNWWQLALISLKSKINNFQIFKFSLNKVLWNELHLSLTDIHFCI